MPVHHSKDKQRICFSWAKKYKAASLLYSYCFQLLVTTVTPGDRILANNKMHGFLDSSLTQCRWPSAKTRIPIELPVKE